MSTGGVGGRYRDGFNNVVVCTDLSANEQHRQVGVDRVMISGNLGSVTLSTLDQMKEMEVRRPALDAIFSIPITAMAVRLRAESFTIYVPYGC